MNILAIGAHFDDVELGCGGALARHAEKGDDVYVYVATKSGFSNYLQEQVRGSDIALAEAQAAMKIIGVKEMICGGFSALSVEFTDELNMEIIKIVEEKKIDCVYGHWDGDIHHDHLSVARATLHSCRHVPRLLMYRSNWYHSTVAFKACFYVDITKYWETKANAIRAHASEMERTGNRWLEFFITKRRTQDNESE